MELNEIPFFYMPVLDILNTPPDCPKVRDTYLIGTNPTNEWLGNRNNIAEWDRNNGIWRFQKPKNNSLLMVMKSNAIFSYKNEQWTQEPLPKNCSTCKNWQQTPQLIGCQVGICWLSYYPKAKNIKLTKEGHYCTNYSPNQ